MRPTAWCYEPRRHVLISCTCTEGSSCREKPLPKPCASSKTAWPSKPLAHVASKLRPCLHPWDGAVGISTFGIGAGAASCGQLLLGYDLLGVFDQFKPKFTKRYAEISKVAVDGLKAYAAEVMSGRFPDVEHSYSMKSEEADALQSLMTKRGKK